MFNYIKTIWAAGDPITAIKMNNLEVGVEALNQQQENIIEEFDAIKAAIAPDYSELNVPITINQYCWNNNELFQAKQNITVQEQWTSSHWQKIILTDIVKQLLNKINQLVISIAPDYTSLSFPVSAGQLCWYSGTLYRAKQNLTSENWTAAHWEAAVVGDELAALSGDVSALNDHFIRRESVDLTNAEIKNYCVHWRSSASQWVWYNGDDGNPARSYFVPITADVARIAVTASVSQPAYVSFLPSVPATISTMDVVTFCSGTSQNTVPAGTTATFDIPTGCTVVNITKYKHATPDYTPSAVTLISPVEIPAIDATLSQAGEAADAKAVGDELADLRLEIAEAANGSKTLNDYALAGAHTITADEMETGAWGYSGKYDNTKRLRNKVLFPIKKGMTVQYTNPTLKLGIVIASSMPTNAWAQNSGWINAGSSGIFTATVDGYLIIMNESANDVTPSDYDCTVSIFSVPANTADIVDEIVRPRGAPATTWTIGILSSQGQENSYKNGVRSGYFSCKKGNTIGTNDGYWIRVCLYNGTTFISRTDWVRSYTASNDCTMRVVVSSTAYKDDPTAVLTDTSFKNQIVWTDFIFTTIGEQIAPLLAAYPTSASGGYMPITDQLVLGHYIDTGSTGATLTLDYVEKSDYTCLKHVCKTGDKFKITGEASAVPRLWCFTDSSGVVKSLSTTFLRATDLVITAPADGYFIYNSNNSIVQKVELFVRDLGGVNEIIRYTTNYDYRNVGNDILSAFSNIMCCGDSLTASVVYTGMNGSSNVTRAAYRRYPEILASKTGSTVEYHALGGYSASAWWTAYNSYIVQKTNQLAIIYLGTNGGLTDTLDTDAPGTDASQYDASTNTGAYCKIVKSFLDVGARVLLLHVNKMTENLDTTNAVIDKIATKFGVAVVTVPYLADDKYHLWPDGTGRNTLHYNDLGYAAFTESLIRNVGALNDNMMARLIPI